MNLSFDPAYEMVGRFTPNDGTIDFYLRINSLVDNQSTVLDLGAGRAGWFEDDTCTSRKVIRLLKGKAKEVIAADVDPVVMKNKASDRQVIIENGIIDLPPNSIDVIVADYVLEHIDDPEAFFSQVEKCLKKGGWFCARTPHKFSYVALVAAAIPNSVHAKLLNHIQSTRKEIDVFPTRYMMNTKATIQKIFKNWQGGTFVYRAEPAYYFGSRALYYVLSFFHRLLPSFFSGNLFIFVRKP